MEGASGSKSPPSRSFVEVSLRELVNNPDAQIARNATLVSQQLPPEDLASPIQEVLGKLVEQRAAVPDKDARLTRLDAAIVPLTTLVRTMYSGGPYDISPAPPSPTGVQDSHMLQDLTEANLLNEASDLLDVKHFSDADGPRAWPVKGVLYGPCKRALVCLPTALRGRDFKNIIYLVDTGAPITELSPHALHALGATEATPSAAYVRINGERHQVYLCAPAGNRADIPVLGADALTALALELRINYKSGDVTLLKA